MKSIEGPNGHPSTAFSESLLLAGSSFSPLLPKPVLGFTEGRAVLTGTGIDTAIDFTLSAANSARVTGSAEKLKLTFDSATGLFGGSFVHPATGRAVPIRGIAVPDEHRAAGFFFAPGASGAVELVPR
jgi:hypothetical protein